jgi:hypothetical protein
MRKPYFTAVVYVAIFAAFGLLAFSSFFDEAKISTKENRSLEELPQLTSHGWFSGSYSAQLTRFLSDHVPGRDGLVAFAHSAEGRFKRSGGVNIVTGNADPIAVSTGAAQSDAADYLLLENRILQIFRYDPQLCADYTAAANDIFALFSADVDTYLMMAPTRIAFEAPEHAQHSMPQEPAIRQVYEGIDSDVVTIDAYGALEQQSVQLENLYFRLDHHWTHTGSYFAAKALWEEQGREYLPIELYERYEGAPFLGYLYAITGSDEYADQHDELVYYLYQGDAGTEVVQKVSGKDEQGRTLVTEESGKIIDPQRQGYYSFLSTSYSCVLLDGMAQDGSVLLMVGDSYISALAPWMAANYEKVIVIDPRFYDEGKDGIRELADKYGITDVLIMNCTVTMNSPSFIARMETLSQ